MSMPGSASGALGKRAARAYAIALIALYIVIYLTPLALRPLARPDEVRYAEIAREMVVSGDWITPRFNGVRYFEKPIMGHWLNAGSFKLFGESAFALRLPTAIAAGLTGLLIFLLTTQFANRRAAFLASGVYLTTFEVLGVGTFAVLDSFLTLFLSAAIASYYFALHETSSRRRQLLFALCGLACGCAFLTKGFLALAIPAMVVGAFLVVERRWRDIWTTPWIPILSAVVVVAPWAVMIHEREPDFWRYFFWVEHVQRFIGANAQHAEPFWYYAARLPGAAFPWFFVALLAFKGLRVASTNRKFVLYVVCWALLQFVFFSLSKGKLMTYVLPCLVPFSVLLGVGLERIAATTKRLPLKWPAVALSAVLVLGLIALFFAQAGTFGDPVYGADEWHRYATVIAALVAGIACTFLASRRRVPRTQLALIGSAVLPLFVTVNFALPLRALENLAPGDFLGRYGQSATDAVLISDSSLFGSMSWFLRRNDVYLVSDGEIAYGLSYPEARHRSLDQESFRRLLARNRGQHDIVIFWKEKSEANFRDLLPDRAIRVQSGELVLWRIPAAVSVDG